MPHREAKQVKLSGGRGVPALVRTWHAHACICVRQSTANFRQPSVLDARAPRALVTGIQTGCTLLNIGNYMGLQTEENLNTEERILSDLNRSQSKIDRRDTVTTAN